MGVIETKTCESCGRDFIPDRCPDHCTPACCRARPCPNAKPPTRNPAAKERRCVACGRSNARFPFEAFAPCDDGCKYTILRGRQGLGATQVRVRYCQGVWMPGSETLHQPHTKPRVHIKYCSLKCWSLPESGHQARVRVSARRRNARYWRSRGTKSTILREMHKVRERNATRWSTQVS